jgi:hypothetical protein
VGSCYSHPLPRFGEHGRTRFPLSPTQLRKRVCWRRPVLRTRRRTSTLQRVVAPRLNDVIRGPNGRWLPGNPGGGRPLGSRQKLAEQFIRDAYELWKLEGPASLDRMPAMRSPNAEREAVPVARDAERPVPDARRQVTGSPEGK